MMAYTSGLHESLASNFFRNHELTFDLSYRMFSTAGVMISLGYKSKGIAFRAIDEDGGFSDFGIGRGTLGGDFNLIFYFN